MLLSLLLILVILITIFSILISSYNESYWKKRGVKYVGGKNIFSFFWQFLKGDRGLFEIFGDAYDQHAKEPAVGTPMVFSPSLLVIDPENIQHVLTDNFQSFYHRGLDVAQDDKLADNVLFMNGNRWKLIRQKMTPLFTSAKLKNMYYIMDKSAQDFVEYIEKNIDKKTQSFDGLSSFCCAAIGSAVFGVKAGESIFNSPFYHVATEVTKPSLSLGIRFTVSGICPKLFKLLKLKLFTQHEKVFITAFQQVLRERENDNAKRYDFPEVAIALQKNGMMRDESTGFELEPTDELMAAQGFFFLIAGVEPTAQGMFSTLFELARRPDIQKRVQKDIDKAFEENDGQMSFDVLSKMSYLDKVIEEALRMHPPISMLGRRCTKDTVLPAGNVKVDKGTQIHISVLSLHNDPRYYPNPEVFDPERFSPENIRERPKATYMPFGDGGRLCIGQRYAYLQMKTGIVHVLRNFNVKVDDVNQKLNYLKTPLFIRPSKSTNFYYERRRERERERENIYSEIVMHTYKAIK